MALPVYPGITPPEVLSALQRLRIGLESETILAGSATVTTLRLPSTSNQQVLFNSGGIATGSASLLWDGASLGLTGRVLTTQGFHGGVASTVTAAATTTLTIASARTQVFTGTTTQTVQLPAANAAGSGRAVEFILKNRATGDLTVQRAGSDTIEGATSIPLTGGQSVTLASNGVSEWVIADSEFINGRWDDVIGFSSIRLAGVNDPSLALWQPGGSGSLRLYEFPAASMKEVFVVTQFPHGVRFGSVVKPHVHFATRSTDTSGVVRWQLEHTIAAIGSAYSAPTTLGGSYTFTTNRQDVSLVVSLDSATLTLPALAPSAIIVSRLFRDGGVSPDTFAGSVFLQGFDFHAQHDKMGTINETTVP